MVVAIYVVLGWIISFSLAVAVRREFGDQWGSLPVPVYLLLTVLAIIASGG